MLPLLLITLAGTPGVAPDGGTLFSDALYAQCPVATGPQARPTPDGWFLPHERAARVGCIMATCEVARREAKALNEEAPNWWLVTVGAVAVAVLGGISIGLVIGSSRPK